MPNLQEGVCYKRLAPKLSVSQSRVGVYKLRHIPAYKVIANLQ